MYPARDLRCENLGLQKTNINTDLNVTGQAFPSFQKPAVLGCFSLDSKRIYEPNVSQLRYYKAKPPGQDLSIDLNEGFGLANTKPWTAYSEGLNNVLKFLFDNRPKGFLLLQQEDATNFVLDAEFVCFRGLLSLLMNTPYERREGWCIHVTRFRGTFYMWRPDTIHRRKEREEETDRTRRFCSYGYKFEQCCLSTSPLVEPDTQSPVDECAEFACVFRTRIKGISMIYCAEMDGILSDSCVDLNRNGVLKLDQLKFVELKVRQQHLNGNQIVNYERHKTRQWWCQSFLAGVRDIYVGLRTSKGILRRIEHKRTGDLPKIGEKFWSPVKCIHFLTHFLESLRTIMAQIDCPHTVFAMHFDPDSKCIAYESFLGDNMHSFLPDWYVDLMNNPFNGRRCS